MAAETSTSGKLPVAKNLDQVLNRIALGLSKHERILKTLNRPSSTPSTTNGKSKPSSSGFSSLSGSSTPTPVQSNYPSRIPTRAEEEAEFAAERALAPNAGIGFAPVKQEDLGVNGRGNGKEDKMLRGRILGKNAREQMTNKGKDKRRYESESEEEEGRSGLGKKKRKAVVVKEEEPGTGLSLDSADKLNEEVSHEMKDEKEDIPVRSITPVQLPAAEATDLTNGKKKKKNKKKKKGKSEEAEMAI
ncbi:hypothetical protein DL546_000305 [Coniochaeta pulveracea]|uniref:Uncharacterized protein n=1 Tax=Coniochaeta pulveracea TaxID=177199 RepID=A0A420XYZ2_9PEZI|nr:hypothetical protein DL546_000305 [Coniochaeta pulveracea]